MKKSLLVFCAVGLVGAVASAQCNPDDHDWGEQVWGVSPNPTMGENFEPGIINTAYHQIVYFRVPSDAGVIIPFLAGTPIDSLHLDQASIDLGSGYESLSGLNLELTCNNREQSPSPCMFIGGDTYCGDISGVPDQAGTFPIKLDVSIYAGGSSTPFPYSFEGITFEVQDPNSVSEMAPASVTVYQNSPNPAASVTQISFELNVPGHVEFTVMNLVGEKVYSRSVQGKKGNNAIRFDTSDIQNGVYLYSISAGERKFTRRMIVQH